MARPSGFGSRVASPWRTWPGTLRRGRRSPGRPVQPSSEEARGPRGSSPLRDTLSPRGASLHEIGEESSVTKRRVPWPEAAIFKSEDVEGPSTGEKAADLISLPRSPEPRTGAGLRTDLVAKRLDRNQLCDVAPRSLLFSVPESRRPNQRLLLSRKGLRDPDRSACTSRSGRAL